MGDSPATATGDCGYILIVNGAGRGIEGWAFSTTLAALNLFGGVLFWLGVI